MANLFRRKDGELVHPAIGIVICILAVPILCAVLGRLAMWFGTYFVWCMDHIGGLSCAP